MLLDKEEYIEQAYLFRALSERLKQSQSTQELLAAMREEALSTTKLPMAIEFMVSELKFNGVFGPAMAKLSHYFTPFQTFLVTAAENDHLRFDFTTALMILEREAAYRAQGTTPQGMFLYQFEAVCRNRLGYDRALAAIASDPIFNDDWKDWIAILRHQVGIVDFADLLYVRSQHYVNQRERQHLEDEPGKPVLFGEKEGKIALANRGKDPLYLFSALERQLGYPTVPRPKQEEKEVLDTRKLLGHIERLDARVRLLEEENRGGIDLTKFFDPNKAPPG